MLLSHLSTQRSGPLGFYSARDDVDHPTHCLGTIQRRHGATHHLDTIDCLYRGQPPLLYAWAITVGPRFTRINALRSEERRVGKECRCRWSTEHDKTNDGRAGS